MGDIRQILEMERLNSGQIRLYKFDKYWLAFERSAFNLFSVYNVDTIIKIKDKEEPDSMLIAIVKNGVSGLYDSQFTILERSENEMLLDCRTNCRGFLYWKENLISSFTDDLYNASDDTFHNICRLNPEELLN